MRRAATCGISRSARSNNTRHFERQTMRFNCNFCKAPLTQTFCDLGTSPVSNSFIKPENAQAPEPFYPLHVYACSQCFLVQLPEHKSAGEIFTDDYASFFSLPERRV